LGSDHVTLNVIVAEFIILDLPPKDSLCQLLLAYILGKIFYSVNCCSAEAG
jgi:hypothetical protein